MGRYQDLTPDEPYVPEDEDILRLTDPGRARAKGGSGAKRIAARSSELGNVRPGTWRPGMSKPEGCLGFRPGWVENFVKADDELKRTGQGGKGALKDQRILETVEEMKRALLAGEEVPEEQLRALGTLVLLDNATSWRPSVRQAAVRELIGGAGKRGRKGAASDLERMKAAERKLKKGR